ncbi:hypothetical protein C8R47DRAFT_512326 [Mycena vitilis]|nr:hypothetical protein C8R47DRAFT_512326 [Mycena vitilis]
MCPSTRSMRTPRPPTRSLKPRHTARTFSHSRCRPSRYLSVASWLVRSWARRRATSFSNWVMRMAASRPGSRRTGSHSFSALTALASCRARLDPRTAAGETAIDTGVEAQRCSTLEVQIYDTNGLRVVFLLDFDACRFVPQDMSTTNPRAWCWVGRGIFFQL